MAKRLPAILTDEQKIVCDFVMKAYAYANLCDEEFMRATDKEVRKSTWAMRAKAHRDLDGGLELLKKSGVATIYKEVLMQQGLEWFKKTVGMGTAETAIHRELARKKYNYEAYEVPVENKELETASKDEAELQNRLYTDFLFFLSTCIKIPYRPGMLKDHPEGGFGFLIPTKAQLALIAELVDQALVRKVPVRMIILKSRQLGCTTLLLAFWLWLCLTIPDFTFMLIIDKNQHNQTKKQQIVDWLEFINKNFSFFPKIKKKEDNIFFLSNRSILMFESAEARNPGTSERLSCLHESEKPKWPASRAKLVKTSILPGIPFAKFTFHINESTAEGMDQFYLEWTRAMNSTGEGITPLFFPWYISDEYYIEPPSDFRYDNVSKELAEVDDAGNHLYTEEEYSKKWGLTPGQTFWRRRTIQITFSGDRNAFDQEYPTTPEHAWRAISSSFFTRVTLDKAQVLSTRAPTIVGDLVPSDKTISTKLPVSYMAIAPKLISNKQGELQVWARPKLNARYFIGGDVAQGKTIITESGATEPDWTVFPVKDESGTMVAMYRSRIKPEDAWLPLLLLGLYYNNAYINVERNNPGETLFSWFSKTGYPNNLVWPKPKGRTPDERTWTELGKANRNPMLTQLRATYNADYTRIVSEDLINELRTFIVDAKTGKAEAASGCHDDIVMADTHCEILRLYCLGLYGSMGGLVPEEEGEPYNPTKDPENNQFKGYTVEMCDGLEGLDLWRDSA